MTETTSETVELTITRIFDAPRELVFRCMLEPEHLTHFWGPIGVSTPIDKITIDPRPGGAFDTVMVNDATARSTRPTACSWRSSSPRRIVWTEPDMGITNDEHVHRSR